MCFISSVFDFSSEFFVVVFILKDVIYLFLALWQVIFVSAG